jgi:putative transposase
MNVFTRSIRSWGLGRSLDHHLMLSPLKRALARSPAPEIHHSDQGVQYAATDYTQSLTGAGVRMSMAETGHPEQNGCAERLMRTIKEGCTSLRTGGEMIPSLPLKDQRQGGREG